MSLTSLEKQLLVANWFYYLGEPVLSDKKYNEYYEQLKSEIPTSIIVTKTWSELEEPVELLKEYNMFERSEEIKERIMSSGKQDLSFMPKENLRLRSEHYEKVKEHFMSETLKSIDTISSLSDSDRWLSELGRVNSFPIDFNFSDKGDGFNIPNYYVNGYYVGSHTRGRGGNRDDVTIAMSKVLPLKIETDVEYLIVITEATCPFDNLEKARKIVYPKELKTARSAVKSLLTPNSGDEMHKLLLPLVINVKGIDFPTRDRMFHWAEINGFTAINNETAQISDTEELVNFIKRLSLIESTYETDGIVVAVNNNEMYHKYNTSGKYDDAIRAYRMFEWSASIYCSQVWDIEPSYNSQNISLTLKIMPTRVASGVDVSSLAVTNPRRLINAGIRQHSLVVFQHKHGSFPELLDFDTVMLNESANGFAKTPQHLVQPLLELHMRAKKMGMIEQGWQPTRNLNTAIERHLNNIEDKIAGENEGTSD